MFFLFAVLFRSQHNLTKVFLLFLANCRHSYVSHFTVQLLPLPYASSKVRVLRLTAGLMIKIEQK
jgi:hypothetical protein